MIAMASVNQGEADALIEPELMTGEAVVLDVRPTGFLLRSLGAIIDWATYLGLFAGLSLLLSLASGGILDSALATALGTASLAFALVIVPAVVEVVTHGRSLGKLAIGARVVRDDGGAEQFRQAFVRSLTGVAEIYLTFGGLAALVALLNGRAKRLGDLLAGTYSQHERVPRANLPVYPVPTELASWATMADVARLPDRLSRRIASFLQHGAAMTPASSARLAATLAQEASAYVSPLPDVSPQLLLVAIAAIRRDRDYAALMLERQRLDTLTPQLTGLPHGFPER